MDDWTKLIVGALAATWAAIAGWFVTQLGKKATKEGTQRAISSVEAKLDEHIDENRSAHRQIDKRLDTTNTELHETNKHLANIAGQLEGHLGKGNAP